MDSQDEALNPVAETETAQTESPTEEQTTDTQTDVSVEEPVVPKKGAQSRIRELNDKVHSLTDRIAELTSPTGPTVPQIPFNPQQTPIADDDGSIDPQEFKRQVLNEANQIIDFRTRQAQVVQRVNQQAEELVRKFGELDPDSDSFNQELSDDVYEILEAKLKADPTADVRKLAAKQVELHRRAASREEKQTENLIAKQSAQSAIRPSQNKSVDTPFEKLSLEEMRAKLGYAQ